MNLCLPALACVALAAGVPPAAHPQPTDALRRDMEVARKRVYPALVNISVVMRYYSGGRAQRMAGGGSGVIVTPQGHVLTNFHVAGHTSRIRCTLVTGETLDASVVAHDPLTDLSVLKVRTEKRANGRTAFPYARLGDSDALQVGDYVMAMGNPLMLSSSVTLGIVSNPKRVFTDFTGTQMQDMELDGGEKSGMLTRWVQHDALILPGNSGGPLVNLRGEVVGINELGGNGVGFAIPANIAAHVLHQVLASGTVRRGSIGVQVMPVDKLGRTTGALVSAIAPGSPAEKAGVRPGDILMAIGGLPVSARFFEEVPIVYQRLADLTPGTTAHLTLLRGGKSVSAAVPVVPMEKPVGDEGEFRDMGLTAQEITTNMARARRLPGKDGVLVTGLRPGYPFEGAQPRLDEGDVLLSVDAAPVNSLAALRSALSVKGKKRFVLSCRRGLESIISVVTVPDEQPDNTGTDLPKAWLGVKTQVLTPEVASALHLGDVHGFRVTEVYPWTEASKAGLQTGDAITSLNGSALEAYRAQDSSELTRLIEDLSAGEKADLTVVRGGKPLRLSVLLEEEPAGGDRARKARQKEFEFGVRDVMMLDRMRNRWTRDQAGVIVSDVTPGGWAQVAGLRPDDLILTIDGQNVTSTQTFETAMKRVISSRPRAVIIFVRRGVQTQFVFIDPDWSRLAAGS